MALLNVLGSGDDNAYTKGAHGDEHDEGDRRVGEHDTHHAGSDKTGDDDWRELRRGGERRGSADGLEEAEAVEDPDAKGTPTKRHTAKYEVHRTRHGVNG